MGQTLATHLTLLDGKSLTRRANRNGKQIALYKASYSGSAASKLQRVADTLFTRVQALKQPVERIIGRGENERVVLVHDDKALCDAARTLSSVLEQQRIVLRIPAPGRDTPSEARTIEMPAAAAIDVQEIERLAKDAEKAVSESEQPPVSPTESAS